jgi:diadenosine tetraphosphatase ApaH/serine/threonine PP2A family protein phosphatase
MDYITSPNEALICFDAMPGSLTLIGHTHLAEYYRLSDETRQPQQLSFLRGGSVELNNKLRYIINPGAVGQPRDGNPKASVGRWQVEQGIIEVRRVAYDIATAQEKMAQANLPSYLIARLAVGH